MCNMDWENPVNWQKVSQTAAQREQKLHVDLYM